MKLMVSIYSLLLKDFSVFTHNIFFFFGGLIVKISDMT